jgi:hypothetical protein
MKDEQRLAIGLEGQNNTFILHPSAIILTLFPYDQCVCGNGDRTC